MSKIVREAAASRKRVIEEASATNITKKVKTATAAKATVKDTASLSKKVTKTKKGKSVLEESPQDSPVEEENDHSEVQNEQDDEVEETEVVSKSTAVTVKPSKSEKPNKKKGKSKKEVITDSRVIYLGHIPDGFFEPEMRAFFSQFGKVTNVKLFRSKKTGGSKGYAFVEFETADIANVVAEAMNGYYLKERVLVSHVVPPEKVHDGMFKRMKKQVDKEKEPSILLNIYDKEYEEIGEEALAALAKKHMERLNEKQKKLAELGIDFDVSIRR